MKPTRLFYLMLVVLLAAMPAKAAQPLIKLATLAPKGTTFEQELIAMGQKWQAAPGGGARLTIFTDGQLGGEADMVRRMRAGQIQASLLTVTGLSYIDDSVAALQNMPMMFRSMEELEFVRDRLRSHFEEEFRKKGFVVLFWGDAGWIRLFSRRPAVSPEDIRRMKIFTWVGNTKTTELWKLAGFQPVELEVTDMLTGLNTGLIDCVPCEPYYALAGQFYGPAPYMLDIKWAPLVGGAVITAKTFDALPADTQKAMLAAAADAGVKLTKENRIQSEKAIETMKTKHGLHVEVASPELIATWRKLCEDFYPKIRGSIVPADTYDETVKLLAEYRKSGDGKQAN